MTKHTEEPQVEIEELELELAGLKKECNICKGERELYVQSGGSSYDGIKGRGWNQSLDLTTVLEWMFETGTVLIERVSHNRFDIQAKWSQRRTDGPTVTEEGVTLKLAVYTAALAGIKAMNVVGV